MTISPVPPPDESKPRARRESDFTGRRVTTFSDLLSADGGLFLVGQAVSP